MFEIFKLKSFAISVKFISVLIFTMFLDLIFTVKTYTVFDKISLSMIECQISNYKTKSKL